MKTSLSDLRKIIREEMSRLNEQPVMAEGFYSTKLVMLGQLMDNLDEAHSALDSASLSAKILAAHEGTADAEDEDFMEHMLELERLVVDLRDNQIDLAMKDIEGELDAVKAMVTMSGEKPGNEDPAEEPNNEEPDYHTFQSVG